ncbi:MAG: dihydroorotase [Phycisphaerae bacterium]
MRTVRHSQILIHSGRVIDAASGRDEIVDMAVTDGLIARQAHAGACVVDASGLIVCPGMVDLHVHLREPGETHKETIETGTAAAAAGGFTLVACMPNTSPPMDSPDIVRFVLQRAGESAHCDVAPVGAITRGRAGRELTDFAAMVEAGAVAFSDDGYGVEDDAVMLAAFEQAAKLNALLIQHCEYKSISAGGVMHLGDVSRRLGLPGLDPRSEEAMIERDLDLCRRTGGRYHVAHISTARAVELVRQAKREGLPVTAEVCPHHLCLTDAACADDDVNTKMHPPLRPARDVEACQHGLLEGTIDCIATDHAPHTNEEKRAGFLDAPPGIVGLETAVGVTALVMVCSGLTDWPDLVSWFTSAPAAVLGHPRSMGTQRPEDPANTTITSELGRIEPGRVANLTLLDPHSRWVVDPERFESKCCNTPFAGNELTGRAVATIRGHVVKLHAGTPPNLIPPE